MEATVAARLMPRSNRGPAAPLSPRCPAVPPPAPGCPRPIGRASARPPRGRTSRSPPAACRTPGWGRARRRTLRGRRCRGGRPGRRRDTARRRSPPDARAPRRLPSMNEEEPACKPDPVPAHRAVRRRRPSIWGTRRRAPLAAYPGASGGPPAPCLALLRTGFAEPAGHPAAGELLPHLSTLAPAGPAASRRGPAVGGLFLWHSPRIAPPGRYPASCPVESGLSSTRVPEGARAAVARPAPLHLEV